MSEKNKKEKKETPEFEIPKNENGEHIIRRKDFGRGDRGAMDAYVREGVARLLKLHEKYKVEISDEDANAIDDIINQYFLLPAEYQGRWYAFEVLGEAREDEYHGRLKADEVDLRMFVRLQFPVHKKVTTGERKLMRHWYHGDEGDITHIARIFGRSHNTIAAIVKDMSMSYHLNEKGD